MKNDKVVKPFGFKDKIGYMFGDFANDFTFILSSSFLMKFYTDVMGVSAGVVGMIMMIARFVDAFTDVTMGQIVDRSNPTKDGKFRPWLKRMCGPVAIASFLIFQSGLAGMSYGFKVAWLFVTYILWGSIFYTSVNIPYGSMASAISADPKDRAELSTWRTIGSTLASPFEQVLGMTIVVGVGCLVCAMGVQKGVERVVKVIMVGLLAILVLLVVRSLTLPGAGAGVSFYLAPDVEKMQSVGWYAVLNAAMTQAFFTLSVGIGNMTIFGSYQSKDRSLTGEAMWIMGLDTFVALMAGLIIFPACFAFGVEPGSGPGLVFVTLPNIFNVMAGGQLWGTLFFIFMSFAALSTVIAVFENIISYSADVWGMERRRATWLHAVGIWVCSLPCALGFNLLADFQPLGAGTCVLDLEDFLISNNILPLGGLFFLLFCCLRRGWGWDNFIAEVDQGVGMKFPRWLRGYVTYVLPCLIIFVFVMGYVDKFWK